MNERLQKEADALSKLIDKAERYERLKNNDDFKVFIAEVEAKSRQYYNRLIHPKPVGAIERKDYKNAEGKMETVLFRHDSDLDKDMVKEAQWIYDTFRRVITMCDDIIKVAKRRKESFDSELEKLNKGE